MNSRNLLVVNHPDFAGDCDAKKLFLKADSVATIGGTNYSGKAKLDPWLIGAGITYGFSVISAFTPRKDR